MEYLLEDSEGGRFSVGRIDGVLRSVASLDREERSEYLLSVTAVDNGSPNSLSSKVEVVVNVVDMNDNAPEFLQKHYSASVLENASLGMDLNIQTGAEDRDLDENGRLRYSIISGDRRGDFLIDDLTGTIKVAKELDYERDNTYQLTIQVEDGGEGNRGAREGSSDDITAGSGVRYDTASVTILILDINDNPPVFEHSPYTIRLLETNSLVKAPDTTAIPKSAIFVASAKDADDYPYNQIEYSFRDGGRHNEHFTINGTTGQIYLAQTLDREREPIMVLELLATDSGTPRLTSTGTLTIIVEDVNDHPPRFENSEYSFSVEENVSQETVVAEVLAEDEDDIHNADVE